MCDWFSVNDGILADASLEQSLPSISGQDSAEVSKRLSLGELCASRTSLSSVAPPRRIRSAPLTPRTRRKSTTHRVSPLAHASPDDRDETAALAGTSVGGAVAAMTARQARTRASPVSTIISPKTKQRPPLELPNERKIRERLFGPTQRPVVMQWGDSEERRDASTAIKKMSNVLLRLRASGHLRSGPNQV